MKLDQTKIQTGGMLRCCIDTVINLDPETEFENGQIIDCKHEREGNSAIILNNGIWEWNKEGRSHEKNIKSGDCLEVENADTKSHS